MRRIYREPKYVKYSKAKQRRILKEIKQRSRRRAHVVRRHSVPVGKPRGKPITLTAPHCFDFIENPDGTIKFFQEFCEKVNKRHKVYLDLSNVDFLAPNALLYILSRFKDWRHRKFQFSIRGNEPQNAMCKRLVRESGFYEFVSPVTTSASHSDDVLKIATGSEVDGKLAKRVLFRPRPGRLDDKTPIGARRTYTTIVELMGNTREHASPKSRVEHLHWHLMAVINRETSEISVSFLDNGAGIPGTLRRKKRELVGDLLEKLTDLKLVKDNKLVHSALNGELRTRTKEGHRGKGLPKIFNAFKQGHVRELVILSNMAYLNLETSEMRDLQQRFHGTLFCWKLTASEYSDEND